VNKKENIVTSLDLSPRIKRPLSIWNPLDYFRLLFWVFFFPQIFPWYIDRFGKGGDPGPVERRLIFQALLVLLITLSVVALGLFLSRLEIDWYILAVGAALGIITGGIIMSSFGISFGLPFGVAFGITFGIVGNIIGIIFAPVFKNLEISIWGIAWGTAIGAAAGMALNVAGSVKSGVDDDVIKGITGGLFFVLSGGIMYAFVLVIPSIFEAATASILSKNLKNTAFFAIGLGAGFILFMTRIVEYLPLAFISLIRWATGGRWGIGVGHVVFLPLPGIRKLLEKDLERNWENGIDNANQLLAYTYQYGPVVKAINNVLARTRTDDLLARISVLVDRVVDWNLIRFCSANLNKQFRRKAWHGFLFLIPRKKLDLIELRTDTSALAACAGYWYFHEQETGKALQAFAFLQELPYGIELYYIAEALNKWFEINSNDEYKHKVKAIVEWEKNTRRLKNLLMPKLRLEVLAVLRKLQNVSLDVEAGKSALSPFKRSSIAQNNKEDLKRLIVEDKEICSKPEWEIIKVIIHNWLEIINKSGWEFPEDELKKPVENPYEGSSGLPVTGTTFIGRDDIIKSIEEHWATDQKISTLVLYGQRRIGKTSILYNMGRHIESNILLIYISMQKIGKVDHTGQLLYRFAETISKAAGERELLLGFSLDKSGYIDMGTGCISFNRLLDKLSPYVTGQKRLVLAIDEFEVIQEKIEAKQIDAEILPYLRDIVQQYNWLGMIFAGLHVIEEMGRDYNEAFFGQAKYIRVSFLKKEDAYKLITHPRPPRIALEYAQDLLEELYRLTAGQPYLIQCLCRELVSQWNERFEREGVDTPRILTLADLPHLITSDFFENAEKYFGGVWKHVTENERILMGIIAEREENAWRLDELAEIAKTYPPLDQFSNLKEAIDLLKRHDFILEEKGNVRFSGELMRRWVAFKEKITDANGRERS
jgi:hypothetical protein